MSEGLPVRSSRNPRTYRLPAGSSSVVHAECEILGYLAFSKEDLEAMKRTRYTEDQIAFALRRHEAVSSVPDIIRKLGVSEQTLYR